MGGVCAAGGLLTLGANALRAASRRTVLVSCMAEDPPSLCPPITTVTSTFEAASVAYNSLLWMDSDGKLHPDLAERYEISPSADTFTFYLRKDVKWHDGTAFTAADVKFTQEEILSKLQPIGRGAFRYLARIDTPDDHTVIVRMSQPYLPFINVPYALGAILPKHLWEGTQFPSNPHMHHPIGTGPYRFAEYIPGDLVRFVKNEDYHVPGQPGFDEYVVRIVPDAAGRNNAFANKEVHILLSSSVVPTEVGRLSKMPDVELSVSKLSGGMFWGAINTRNAPYNDVRVRHAIAHAIDREFIRHNVLSGLSQSSVGPLWPGSPLYNHALKDYGYDPGLANKILSDAGYMAGAEGYRFGCRLLYLATDSRIAKMGEVISQSLAAVGIKTVLTPLENATLVQRGFVESQFDILLQAGTIGPDPDSGTERFYNSKNILPQQNVNNSAYHNPLVDKLFDEQRVQTSFEKRKAIYDRIQEIIWRDVPWLPIGTYGVPAMVHGDVVTGVFRTFSPVVDNMASARPVSKAAGPLGSAGRLQALFGSDCSSPGLG